MSSESETDIDDDIFELACNYKLTGKYPKDCPQNKKRTIRRQAKSIILQNGEVWKERKMNGKTKVKSCEVCQSNSAKLAVGSTGLHPIPVVTTWHHVSIDFVGPISPISTSGNRYILTLSDQFSKWVEAVAVPTKEAHRVASALYKIFMQMGLPKVLTTDNGSEFRNKLNAAMLKKLGIRHSFITPYHPQSNGLDERLAHAPNTSNQIAQVAKERQEILKDVKHNILAAQAKQKQHYDAKHTRAKLFDVGVLVLKKDFFRSQSVLITIVASPFQSVHTQSLRSFLTPSLESVLIPTFQSAFAHSLQSVYATAFQSTSAHSLQSVYTTAFHSVYTTAFQSVYTTAFQSVYTTAFQSVYTTAFHSVYTTAFQSVYTTAFQSTSAHSLQSVYTTAFHSVYTTAFQSVYTTAFQSVYTTAFQSVYTTAFQSTVNN
ncbi:hypothetical protein EMCRGX_G022782 [Ephydatia muelleri]|eukprot:Em0017g824a